LGYLIDGRWVEDDEDTRTADGRYLRLESRFRNWITPDGRPGPSGEGGFPAAAGRYHLYVSFACPWAHRTLILRRLERLEGIVGLSVVHWHMGDRGWTFAAGPGCTGDRLYGSRYLYELYLRADPRYSGRVTVPVLWDRERETIVSNESAEILRMFDHAFDVLRPAVEDWYPQPLRAEIDALNARIYESVNNGVYRAGFATRQEAYEEAVVELFATLDELEARLSRNRYLLGDRVTEADWRLFPTLIRFDAVYHGHFKCNLRRLVDYPALWAYTRELYQWPGVRDTVRFDHIKKHYYGSHRHINPTGIVPLGPEMDFEAPHGRGALVPSAAH